MAACQVIAQIAGRKSNSSKLELHDDTYIGQCRKSTQWLVEFFGFGRSQVLSVVLTLRKPGVLALDSKLLLQILDAR